MRTPTLFVLGALATACSTPAAPSAPAATPPSPTSPDDHHTTGTAHPVDPGQGLPPGHPEVPLADPTTANGHVGRAPRRLNVLQLRNSLVNAVGLTWTAPHRVLSSETTVGYIDDPNADMLALLASTLGQPDYLTFTAETIDPAPTFSKLVGDAARKACRDGLTADVARPAGSRILLRYAGEGDTAAAAPAAVRQNLAYLALRFWARPLPPADPTVNRLMTLFTMASTAPAQPATTTAPAVAAGTPSDGWRAVCIALITDNQFLTY